ncbi:hypothetical protein COSO111634_35825 [Corallococcus soli]
MLASNLRARTNFLPSLTRSRRAHSAGDRVRATSAERLMENAMVSANCR